MSKCPQCDGTCQPYSMRPTYQVLEAQVKELEDVINDKNEQIQRWRDRYDKLVVENLGDEK